MFYNKNIFQRCFCYKGKYWYKNITSIPLYFKLMHELIKYGYDEIATWETFNWFINTMKSVLTRYNKTRQGTPLLGSLEDANIEEDEKMWQQIIKRMLELLDKMDEEYYISQMKTKHKYEDYYPEMEKAKDEFFKLFSEHFYRLWD